ncbi:MAG: helix-hairpin-helix domain-containing protein [Bacteroidota bacterium]
MRPFFDHINEQLKAYLSFNYAERRGIMVLVLLIILVEGANAILPQIIEKETDDFSGFKDDIRKFELALAQADSLDRESIKKKKEYTPRRQYPNTKYRKKASPAKPPVIIEINTADSAELVRLYGIGAVFAGRILKYRGLLGGFFSPTQLLEVYGMDSIRYDQIKDHVIVDPIAMTKIQINTADFKSLLRHPYLDYETVKAIFNYRQKNDSIANADTLKRIVSYDPMFEKVKHYIEY